MDPLLDLFSGSFSVAGNKVDFTPFIKLVGGEITDLQYIHNLFSHSQAVYPLNQLVNDPGTVILLQQQLNLESILSLVDVKQLRVSTLKGTVTLSLQISDISQIYNENLLILDGSSYVDEIPIYSTQINLGPMPIGVYSMQLP